MTRKLFRSLLVLVLGLSAAGMASAQDSQTVVSRVEGQPMLVRGGEKIPATMGMTFQDTDTVQTNAGCQLDLSVNGMAGCRVLPSSEVSLAQVSGDDMRVEIKSGNAIFNLKKLPSQSTFRVETPTAVASVRGTQFWGRVDGAQTSPVTTFAVREGSVEITAKAAGKTFILEKGQALDIPMDAAAVPEVRPALQEELDAMQQASAILTSA